MGFFVELPEHRKKPVPELVGPIVRLGVCSTKTWSAVIFVACKHQHVELAWCIDGKTDKQRPEAQSLGTAGGWHFWRWSLDDVPLTDGSQTIVYELVNGAKASTERIAVPGASEEWRIMAYSCYDQRRAVGEALWRDVVEKHKQPGKPYHVILGGGDQLYNDNVMALEVMEEWLQMPKEERLKYVPSKGMVDAVEDYYLQAYLSHTHYHVAADMLKQVPQINEWDDHDAVDGYGSYPEKIQTCPVFQLLGQQAQRFYLLFQHATTPQHAAKDGYIVNPGANEREFSAFHFVTQLGPSMFVVAPDARSQRTREHIITDDSYKRIETAMKGMARTTKHLVLLSATPIVYPSLSALEGVLKAFEGASATTQKLLFKTGLYDKIYSAFDEPDLLDDVTDHWSAKPHLKEKEKQLALFHKFAKEHKVRVTIVSGDVHLGAFTYLRTSGQDKAPQATDPGFMPQIVTSGIGNNPPEDFVVKYIAHCGRKPRSVTPELTEHVGRLFKSIETRTGSEAFNNRMNYVDMLVRDVDGKGLKGLEFKMVFLGGDPIKGDEIGDSVEAVVPPLLDAGAQQAEVWDMEACLAEKPKLFRCFCC